MTLADMMEGLREAAAKNTKFVGINLTQVEINPILAEYDKLRAEVERLSSTLVTNRDMAEAEAICERILADEEPSSPIDWRHDIAQAIANGRRAALEPKP